MTQKKTNSYADEIREGVIKLAIESNQPVAQSARKLGVHVNILYAWINKFHGEPSACSIKQVNDVHLYEGLKQLRCENA